MWRVGKVIVFTERLVPGEAIQAPNIAESFYRAVGERRSQYEDGEQISEWLVPFSEVLSFLASE